MGMVQHSRSDHARETPARHATGARRAHAALAVALAAAAAAALLGLCVGRFPVDPWQALGTVVDWLAQREPRVPAEVAQVVLGVRGPRVVAGLLAGASLAAAGAAYQAILRNPLVAPDILGVSSGAAVGAVVGILLHGDVLVVQAAAFAGGLAAVVAAWSIAALVRRHDATLVLLLAGVLIGSLLAAIVSLLKSLADPYDQLPSITFWLLGGLGAVRPVDAWSLVPPTLVGLAVLALLRWRIDVASLPDDEARALGVEVARVRWAAIAAATLMTAAAVAVAGVIGWIGLLVPHLARMSSGPAFGRLLATSALVGAALLSLVDTAARSVAPIELPLGALTAALGTPLFVWVLVRARSAWQ